MILLLSQGALESTTDKVCDYLRSAGHPHLRINGSDLDTRGSFTLSIEDGKVVLAFESEGLKIDLRQVKAVWYRRWLEHQPFERDSLVAGVADEAFAASHLAATHLLAELRRVSQLFFLELAGADWLSEPRTASPNKLVALQLAARAGLDTPATLVTTSREELLRFVARFGTAITKPIGDCEPLPSEDGLSVMFTEEIDTEGARALPDRFFPSLFQERLDKRYELRVFFLAGELYAAALFSQSDARTRVDLRHQNPACRNRTVPYRLSTETAGRLRNLMTRLELETGSIDLVRTKDGRIVFLEVNPAGQFGMVSESCNFHLERKVAETLARKAGYGAP